MRARGAQVTDIVVLVIAADDGVMPQTVEALNHAKAAGVAIIIAINKMDKPGANPDAIKRELAKHNIIPDIDGGETLFVEVSAIEGTGIDELLETIILQAELMDLKGYPGRRLMGVVIESQLDKRRGPVTTIIIKEGVLKTGDEFMVGSTSGKVRAMNDSFGERVDKAEPGKAVEILGLEGVPDAGDILLVADKNVVNELTTFTREKNRIEDISTPRISLDDWFTQLQDGGQKDLNVIVKGDVYGTSEVINDVLESIHTETININIIHSGVGNITENDILLAEASNAIVIGFGVDIDKKANELKTKTGIDVNTYDIIYDLIEDIEKAIEGMLEPEIKEVLIGKVEVRKIFTVSSMGVVAGSFVKEGKVVRGAKAKLMREEEEVYSGKIDTLRRFESDVKEVKKGYECGITLQNFNDIKEGDMIFVYQHTKVKREFKIEND
jgi:translation initiation factor IF-2